MFSKKAPFQPLTQMIDDRLSSSFSKLSISDFVKPAKRVIAYLVIASFILPQVLLAMDETDEREKSTLRRSQEVEELFPAVAVSTQSNSEETDAIEPLRSLTPSPDSTDSLGSSNETSPRGTSSRSDRTSSDEDVRFKDKKKIESSSGEESGLTSSLTTSTTTSSTDTTPEGSPTKEGVLSPKSDAKSKEHKKKEKRKDDDHLVPEVGSLTSEPYLQSGSWTQYPHQPMLPIKSTANGSIQEERREFHEKSPLLGSGYHSRSEIEIDPTFLSQVERGRIPLSQLKKFILMRLLADEEDESSVSFGSLTLSEQEFQDKIAELFQQIQGTSLEEFGQYMGGHILKGKLARFLPRQ